MTEINTVKTLILTFDMNLLLRFLSHQETLNMLTRALVRAGVELKYSQGFNPHPKISIPLPRTVGIRTEGDRLCAGYTFGSEADIEKKLASQLPHGCDVTDVTSRDGNVKLSPVSAEYRMIVSEGYDKEKLNERVAQIIEIIDAGRELEIERSFGPKKKPKKKNVTPFLRSAELDERQLLITVNVSPAGTVRYSELLEIFSLNPRDLDEPAVRRNIKWIEN